MIANIKGMTVSFDVSSRSPDAPWITLSHPMTTNLHIWDDIAAVLRQDFNILRYDLRGHGETQVMAPPYDFPMLTQDVINLWDHLEIQRSHFVGLSIGGMIGYGLAVTAPDRILSLTSCGARASAPPEFSAYFQARIDLVRTSGMASVVDSSIRRWFSTKTFAERPPIIEKLRRMLEATEPAGHEGCCACIQTLNYGPDLARIAIPALIVSGSEDQGAPPAVLAQVARDMPSARYLEIEDAGHMMAAERPSIFAREVLTFLNSLSTPVR
jgi:3-oxoadipate enol-lactonase